LYSRISSLQGCPALKPIFKLFILSPSLQTIGRVTKNIAFTTNLSVAKHRYQRLWYQNTFLSQISGTGSFDTYPGERRAGTGGIKTKKLLRFGRARYEEKIV
jgi:hypothetical protein